MKTFLTLSFLLITIFVSKAQYLGKTYDFTLSDLNTNSKVSEINAWSLFANYKYSIRYKDKDSGNLTILGFDENKICIVVCDEYFVSDRDGVLNDFNKYFTLTSTNHWKNCGNGVCHYYTTDIKENKFLVYKSLNP